MKLGLCIAQADITAAFAYSTLYSDEKIFVHHPVGFQRGIDLVLSFDCSLYGLCQAPHYFLQHLNIHMECHRLLQTLDPCLYVGKKVIALRFMDDILFYACKNQDIDTIVVFSTKMAS
ncbi:hypothetical protein ACHAW6_005449 [Cyclotella cf. meneghiniana]